MDTFVQNKKEQAYNQYFNKWEGIILIKRGKVLPELEALEALALPLDTKRYL